MFQGFDAREGLWRELGGQFEPIWSPNGVQVGLEVQFERLDGRLGRLGNADESESGLPGAGDPKPLGRTFV